MGINYKQTTKSLGANYPYAQMLKHVDVETCKLHLVQNILKHHITTIPLQLNISRVNNIFKGNWAWKSEYRLINNLTQLSDNYNYVHQNLYSYLP